MCRKRRNKINGNIKTLSKKTTQDIKIDESPKEIYLLDEHESN
jgi:hypothetical protein